MAALVKQIAKLQNGLIGQFDSRFKVSQVGDLLVAPEQPIFQVATRLLQLVHALNHGCGGVTEQVHLGRIVPERLGNIGDSHISALVLPERIWNTCPACLKAIPKRLHLPQHHKGKAPRGIFVVELFLPLFGRSLMRGDLVRGVDRARGKQSLCPRCSGGPPAQRLAKQFKRVAIERICHSIPLSLMEKAA